VSRRGNGEGTISQRKDGRWEARVSLDDGRRCFYGTTRTEVAEKLKTALSAQQRGELIVASPQSFEAWAGEWLAAARGPLRYSGWRKHEERMRNHVVPAIGRTPLAKVTPERLDRLYADKIASGLSAQTVHHIHATIHKCLELAMRRGRVMRNVADLVTPPAVEARDMATLTGDEYRALLREASGDATYGPFFIVSGRTGMRKSELLGLRWRDVDLDAGAIHLSTVLERVEGVLNFAKPKSKAGKRRIQLTTDAVLALRRQRARQRELRLAAGAAWRDLDLVFTREDGQPLAESTLRRAFIAMLRRAGASEIRIHDLRHTVATLLLGADVHQKIVSEMLGHSRTSITMDLYSHVTPTMQREAVSALEAIGAAR
jgi:integrase